ncbi:hypothetical protein EW146_g7399 [Bondarzewia mesenterica]|uniref:Phytocyanin domain-containing protein n=1 Tax=Bondarzewia mesenterica TaxID=1095465 RepID=A0A4S4LKW3_9AGAM|nr:hypothetical protein EW146_g7399 [Bondarzewia mesenterica]
MFASFLGFAAAYATLASARPMPDNNIGEVAVSAPNGTPESAVATPTMAAGMSMMTSGSSYGGSNYGSSGSSMADSSWSSSAGYAMASASADMAMASSSTYMAMASSSADMAMATSTASAYVSSYTSASYGSGSSNWGGSGYDSCVQQCVASFGAASAMSMPSATSGSEGSSGTGATHTVWVAPTQGVLRYVPFATNASVGDTIKFIWGGNDHTVTKSSILGICNKTADAPFVSGTHNLSFVFTQVVNDTNPTFFYCGTPTHCQKGMFGIINPPNAFGGASSVNAMMPSIASNSSDTSAALSYSNMMTSNSTGASNWGMSMDMSQMPAWSHSYMAENVLYTRAFLGANPEVLKADGTVDMSAIGSNPVMLPKDVVAAGNNAASGAAASNSASSSASSSSSATTSATSPKATSGAGMLTSSRVVVALVAVMAVALAL